MDPVEVLLWGLGIWSDFMSSILLHDAEWKNSCLCAFRSQRDVKHEPSGTHSFSAAASFRLVATVADLGHDGHSCEILRMAEWSFRSVETSAFIVWEPVWTDDPSFADGLLFCLHFWTRSRPVRIELQFRGDQHRRILLTNLALQILLEMNI